MIRARDLTKHFKVHKRPPGFASALRSLVRRRYETVKAVDGVSFTIERGERVGFLGPNGAGKTTTLKVLSGLLHPTGGEVVVEDHVPFRRQASFLGKITLVMGQKSQLIWDLPPAETYAMNRAVFDVPARAVRPHARRAHRAARARAAGRQADPPAVARRAHEVRARGRAAPPADHAVPRRADHRARRRDAGRDPRLRAQLQPAPRRDRAADLALHGRRRRAVPADHRDRSRQADPRRRSPPADQDPRPRQAGVVHADPADRATTSSPGSARRSRATASASRCGSPSARSRR